VGEAWCYVLTSIWFVWLVVPTIFINPLLRKLGVPIYYLPIDVATRLWGRGCLLIAGIKAEVEGTSEEPCVIVCNHLSALGSLNSLLRHAARLTRGTDAFVIYAYAPITMRFIMKQTMLFYCPPVFVMAWAVGCITINRTNRDKAIDALKSAAVKIKNSGRAVSHTPCLIEKSDLIKQGITSSSSSQKERGPRMDTFKSSSQGLSIRPGMLVFQSLLWPSTDRLICGPQVHSSPLLVL
jgi:hypothetical protein